MIPRYLLDLRSELRGRKERHHRIGPPHGQASASLPRSLTGELKKEVEDMGSASQALIDYTKAMDGERTVRLIRLIRSGTPGEEAAKQAGYDPERDHAIFEELSRPWTNPAVLQP